MMRLSSDEFKPTLLTLSTLQSPDQVFRVNTKYQEEKIVQSKMSILFQFCDWTKNLAMVVTDDQHSSYCWVWSRLKTLLLKH